MQTPIFCSQSLLLSRGSISSCYDDGGVDSGVAVCVPDQRCGGGDGMGGSGCGMKMVVGWMEMAVKQMKKLWPNSPL